jgi:glycosyltransferase involved in cell wall biosynthesis
MQVDVGWLERLQSRRPYLLYLGQWKPYKNLSTLLAAFEKISAERGDLQLVIGGRDDPRYPAPKEAAARSGGRILVTGWIPSAALPALYQAAAAFVMPSLYEGFGLPVLEAMAWGAPVVCARATSLPEVVGDAAQYWEPATGADGLAEAIKAALHPDRAAELRRRGLEQASRFSWEETARRTAAVYAEVLAGIG